jgi:hypothetical protein
VRERLLGPSRKAIMRRPRGRAVRIAPASRRRRSEVVVLPALAQDAEAYRVETVLGRQSFGRKARRTPSGSRAMTVR